MVKTEAIPALENKSNNLPVPLTSFVGRAHELGEVKKLLAHYPLLTLLGTGGVGKTRLVVQFAKTEARNYPKGPGSSNLLP